MTIDDLLEIHSGAVQSLMRDAHHWGNPKPSKLEKRRVGLAAVVLALRCEARKNWAHADNMFLEILSSEMPRRKHTLCSACGEMFEKEMTK